jgi:DUF438 domain-containing protein
MSHNPVKTLMDEHEFIASAQTIVRKLKNLWESDPDAYREALDKLLDFFVRYSDGFHHHKEEEVLFPQMRDHPGFMLGDILQELEEHHDAFREFVQDIRAAAGSGEFKGAQDLRTTSCSSWLKTSSAATSWRECTFYLKTSTPSWVVPKRSNSSPGSKNSKTAFPDDPLKGPVACAGNS